MTTKASIIQATRPAVGYNIKVVARRTGLSPHVIRVWERRYGAVAPARSATARRLYNEAEIERLLLLRLVTQAGHSIGQVANLTIPRLAELVAADNASLAIIPPVARTLSKPTIKAKSQPGAEGLTAADYLRQCEATVNALDADALEVALTQAALILGPVVMMEEVLSPLLRQLGECWRQGTARIYHEHLVTAVARDVLGASLRCYAVNASAPLILVTTLAGQTHELGALMAAVTAAATGWKSVYLGPNLPVEEVAASILRLTPRAVALSIIYSLDDFYLREGLKKLRAYIPAEVTILVGGQGIAAADVEAMGARHLADLPTLYNFLATRSKVTLSSSTAATSKSRTKAVKLPKATRRQVAL